jgi:hypothetical protein
VYTQTNLVLRHLDAGRRAGITAMTRPVLSTTCGCVFNSPTASTQPGSSRSRPCALYLLSDRAVMQRVPPLVSDLAALCAGTHYSRLCHRRMASRLTQGQDSTFRSGPSRPRSSPVSLWRAGGPPRWSTLSTGPTPSGAMRPHPNLKPPNALA